MFHILRPGYISYAFMVIHRFKEIRTARKIVLGILFGLSQDNRFCGSCLSFVFTVFLFSSFLQANNQVLKEHSLQLKTFTAKDI